MNPPFDTGGDLVVLQGPPPIHITSRTTPEWTAPNSTDQRILSEDPQRNSGSTL